MIKEHKKNTKQNFAYWIIIIFSISLAIVLFYTTTEKFDKQYISSSTISGKKIHQIMFGHNCDKVAEKVKNEISKIEEIISSEIYGSDVEKINKSEGKWVKVNKLTIEILEKVLNISKYTHGIYDHTCLNLVNIYRNQKNISKDDLQRELKKTNYKFIKIDKEYSRVKIENDGTFLTLDDILDGLFCNKAIEVYKSSKISKALVKIGSTTGYFNYTEEKNTEPKNGFICDLSGSEIVVNSKTGELSSSSYSLYHPTDGIIANILARTCVFLDEKESKNLKNFFMLDS